MRGSYRGRGGPSFNPPRNYGNFNPRPIPYDMTMTILDSAAGSFKLDDVALNLEVTNRAQTVSMTDLEKNIIGEFQKRVLTILEKEKETQTIMSVKIQEIVPVGSFTKGVALNKNSVADVAIVLSTLPTPENVAELGTKIAELLRVAKPHEIITSVVCTTGVQLTSRTASVKLLVTTIPENARLLEPGFHMSEKDMMLNFFATRHVKWFTEAVGTHAPYPVLVRALKDVRNRNDGLKPISSWVLEYLAYYCLMNTPNHKPLNIGAAFKRFFELISSGILLPNGCCLLDPTSPNNRVGFDLSMENMDLVCATSQTILRILCTGLQGYKAVLGTNVVYLSKEITKEVTVLGGVAISPLESAFTEGCMDADYQTQPAEAVTA